MRYLFRLIRKIWDMFSSAITVFIIIMILNTFVFVNAYIPSTSMFPTVNKGDRIMGYRRFAILLSIRMLSSVMV